MLTVVPDEAGREDLALTIDEIVRLGAQRILAVALEAKADAYIEGAKDHRDGGRPGHGGPQRPGPTEEGHHQLRGRRGPGRCRLFLGVKASRA